MTQQQSSITLLRHGEPVGGQIFRGITDDVLTEQGWKQMKNAVSGLTGNIDHILTSPLRRCSEFALKLAAELVLPVQQMEALKEINFGQWEGKSVHQIESISGESLHNFWHDPIKNTPPDGESLVDFQQRVMAFWQDSMIRNQGKNYLILTHGGVLKLILAEVLQMPVQAIHNIEVPYACRSTIQVYYSGTEYVTTLKYHGSRVETG